MSYTVVDDCITVDLNRHAIIEASAGTGKTYTIENLVVRLLKEKSDIALENILVVTFTEKGTCELKIRIREKLEQELDAACNDSVLSHKIKDNLDAFDIAPIYTIHGFCHTVLKDFAFENGSLFQNEVIHDAPLFKTLLKEQMRKDWPEIYQEYFPEMLSISGFGSRKDGFLSMIVDIALRTFKPGSGDEIKPYIKDRDIKEIRAKIKVRLMELKGLMGPSPAFSEGFSQLNIHAGSKKSVMEKIVTPLEGFLSKINENNLKMEELSDLIYRIQSVKSSGKQGIDAILIDKWLKKGANPEVCPDLEKVVEVMKMLMATHTELVHFLAVHAIIRLQEDAAKVKQQNGWISYDDMLSQVETAVYRNNSSDLLEKLRKKYRVAFVDEFQDTDPVQWRIFKKIFIDNYEKGFENILYLIGDPKQAIYSFRGADVYTYLDARNEMERLSRSGKANLYSLAVNWRSCSELIKGFNHLFSQKEWFPPFDEADKFGIGYQKAVCPDEKEHQAVLVAGHSRGSPLNIIDLQGPASPKSAMSALAKFMAAEIRHLVTSGGIEIPAPDGIRRPLDFGDICILVRGKSEVFFIEPELKGQSIPYSFYKKPGLFFSDEAFYLSQVFHAVLDPGSIKDVKKALLTPFFELELTDLYDYEDLPAAHLLKQLLFQWNEYARSRKWSLLFRSLLEDSGFYFRESERSGWDRKYTNYCQIFEHLEAVAYQKNLDFRGISALIDSYGKETIYADDADIHQIETDERKVKIMTMHVSKGLQFPVVFIAGGLTQPGGGDYHAYHVWDKKNPDAGSRKIIDLAKQSKDTHARERMDEDKRLFYVAMTRARYKLYVPFYPFEGKHNWVGPVCRFLASSIKSAFCEEGESTFVSWLKGDIQAEPGEAGVKPDKQLMLSENSIDEIPNLLPLSENYRHRKIMLESFSSLHRKIFYNHEQLPEDSGFRAMQEKSKEDDEGYATFGLDDIRVIRNSDEMPGGTEVGSMFHDILEHIDFDAVTKNPDSLLKIPETRAVVLKYMEIYRVNERWKARICEIIADTLTTPVSVVEDGFILGSLKKEDRLHEVEFYYPFSLPLRRDLKIPDCEVEKGHRCFIRGFVDLVFFHKEKYFIADWKSNRIDAGYDHDALKANMNHSGYHLQYKLYTIAVMRWLKHTFGGRFDPERQFGGIFYFYLRGMGTGNGNGIYYVSPKDVGRLKHLEKEIEAAVHRVQGAR